MSKSDEKNENDAESTAEDISNTLVLEGNFGIADVEAMYQQLNDMLMVHKEIVIESGELGRIDAAALQLLHALVKGAAEQDATVSWKSVSDDLRQSATTLGLAEGMGLS